MNTYVDFSEILKNIVVIATAITGVTVAWMGLNTWRKQLHGSVEYELARKILNLVYKKREGIRGIRRSSMWGEEMPTPPEERLESMNDEQKNYYGVSGAYQARWERFQEIDTELNTVLLEGEVVWGGEFKDLFEWARRLESDLLLCLRTYLRTINPDEHEDTREASRQRMGKCKGIMYSSWDENDVFGNNYNESISPIEAFFKEHLKRER